MKPNETVDAGVLEQKIVSMLDALQEGVVQVGNAAVKYAPDVQEAVLAVIRIDALANIINSLLACVICFVIGKLCYKLHNKCKITDPDWDRPAVFFTFLGVCLSIGLFIASLTQLFDLWLWVGVFEPKLALAKQIVSSVLK